jgi:hypothetical protein
VYRQKEKAKNRKREKNMMTKTTFFAIFAILSVISVSLAAADSEDAGDGDVVTARDDATALEAFRPDPLRIRTLEAACDEEITKHCATATATGASPVHPRHAWRVGDLLACLQSVSTSRKSSVCQSWVDAYEACEKGLRARKMPCDLNQLSIHQCMRNVDPHLLPDACTSHSIFDKVKDLSRSRHHRRRQF